MPDISYYTEIEVSKITLSAGIAGSLLWNIMDLSLDWLTQETSPKWERIYKTGSSSEADFEQYDILGTTSINTWDPLGQEHPGGTHTNVAPTIDKLSRTQYFKWDENFGVYGKQKYHFFWTTTKYMNVSSPFTPYTAYFNGTYSLPVATNFGSAYIPHLTTPVPDYSTVTGWGGVPSGALPVGEGGYYPNWPQFGSHDEPPARTPADYAWSYDSQPGWTGETITNPLFTGTNDDFTIHCFAGEENGAPYFYVVIETRTTTPVKTFSYYTHLGFGALNKTEDYYGGNFAAGNYSSSYLDSPSASYEARMFSNSYTLYDINGNYSAPSSKYNLSSSGRSRILFSPDVENVEIWEDRRRNYLIYEFGTQDLNLLALSEIYPSFFLQYTSDYLTGKSILRPYMVLLTDPRDTQNNNILDFRIIIGTAPGIRGASFTFCRDKAIWTDENGEYWKLLAYRSLQSVAGVYCSGNLAIAYRIPIFLEGDNVGTSSETGDLEVGVSLVGNDVGTSSAKGDLNALTGADVGTSSETGNLKVGVKLAGGVVGTSSETGEI